MLIVKGLLAGLKQIVVLVALLIVPAGLIRGGTWLWDRALWSIAVYGLLLGATTVALALLRPASLEARLKPMTSTKQPTADRVATAILAIAVFGQLTFIPLDVFWLEWLHAPSPSVSIAGALVSIIGFAIITAAIYQNEFAMPIVEDQTESGQTVIDTGLYGIVRHPLYLGFVPLLAGLALWLGSTAAFVATAIVLLAFIPRIVVEERTLRETLPGYIEYMEKVRYRIVPYLW